MITLVEVRAWRMRRDLEGHREYQVKHLLKTDTKVDGPYNVLASELLPVPGDVWQFFDDVDTWAFCLPSAEVVPVIDNKPNIHWEVTQTFSTKPPARCQTEAVGDPLLEPAKVSGGLGKERAEATRAKSLEYYQGVQLVRETNDDLADHPLLNSAHEMIRGPQVEYEDGFEYIRIVQNVADLQRDLLQAYFQQVNDSELWGNPPRFVKLSGVSWEQRFSGSCDLYYTRTLEFEIRSRPDPFTAPGPGNQVPNPISGHDRDVLDEGTKALSGSWRQFPGSGCTLHITGVGGVITAAAVGAAGTGYPASAKIDLRVTGGGGTGGVVQVQTNAAGAVTDVTWVRRGGTGYVTTAGAATATITGWVLNNIDGSPPNKNNPRHFVRYQDVNGNTARVILNGEGEPAGTSTVLADTTDEINADTGTIRIKRAIEVNFLELGLPVNI